MKRSYTYSSPLVLSYALGQFDFGAGGDTHKLIGPPGLRGMIVGVDLFKVTEAFTATTTPAYINIGDGSDADKYVSMSLGTTAIDAVDTSQDAEIFHETAGMFAADEQPVVTFVAPTGGTPAGIGEVMVHVAWFE